MKLGADVCGGGTAHLPVLVTGAAGFVGRAVVEVLGAMGVPVVTHARQAAPGIDWAVDLASLCSRGRPGFLDDLGAIVHCAAAIPSRSRAFERDNAVATASLAGMLDRAKGLRRIVYLSSVSVYVRPLLGRWVISEEAETVRANDPAADAYARSKRASELALDSLAARRPEISISYLRPSSIYGCGMVQSTLLPAMSRRALRHEPLRLHGSRGYRQNFVHVRDVAEIAAALAIGENAPSVVNAFSDDTLGLYELADLLRTRLGSSSAVVDNTDGREAPEPEFLNALAKRVHHRFRRLADHLLDAT